MKPVIAVILFAVVMTVLSILYLGRSDPLPAAQIAVLFVLWLLIGGSLAGAARWLKGRRGAKNTQPRATRKRRKAGRRR